MSKVTYHIEADTVAEANLLLDALHNEVVGQTNHNLTANDLIALLQEAVGEEQEVRIVPVPQAQEEQDKDRLPPPPKKRAKKKVAKKRASKKASPPPEETTEEEVVVEEEQARWDQMDYKAEGFSIMTRVFTHSDDGEAAVRSVLSELGYEKFREVPDDKWPEVHGMAVELAKEFGLSATPA